MFHHSLMRCFFSIILLFFEVIDRVPRLFNQGLVLEGKSVTAGIRMPTVVRPCVSMTHPTDRTVGVLQTNAVSRLLNNRSLYSVHPNGRRSDNLRCKNRGEVRKCSEIMVRVKLANNSVVYYLYLVQSLECITAHSKVRQGPASLLAVCNFLVPSWLMKGLAMRALSPIWAVFSQNSHEQFALVRKQLLSSFNVSLKALILE